MSSRRLQDVFSVTIFRLPRCLEDVLREFLKTSWRRVQDVFVGRLEDVLEDVKLWRWRSVEGVFKTCLEDQLMFAGYLSGGWKVLLPCQHKDICIVLVRIRIFWSVANSLMLGRIWKFQKQFKNIIYAFFKNDCKSLFSVLIPSTEMSFTTDVVLDENPLNITTLIMT